MTILPPSKPPVIEYIAVVCVGVAAFLLAADTAILDPRNTAWLMKGDPATHFLGWEFFRRAPLVQWPIGANPYYGMEMSSSVVFTDSIPLLALLFKPFSPWLTTPFQYTGWWILLCFLLQAVFAWKLLARTTQDAWLRLLGSAFFVLAPFLLWRLEEHYALFGQGVIVASLVLYLREKYSPLAWTALLGAAVLIHAYLFVMVGGVWAADLARRFLMRERNGARLAADAAAAIGATLLLMWAAGYFMIRSGVGGAGFGIYRTNLFSMIDPDDVWSVVLTDLKSGRGEYEGFAYAGIGMLALMIVAAAAFVRSGITLVRKKHVPLCAACVLFVLLALSNHIAAGPHVILSYPLPSFMDGITGMLRVSGRFLWPVSYLLYACALAVVFRTLPHRASVVLCAVLLILQVADMHHAFAGLRDTFRRPEPPAPALRSSDWDAIAAKYSTLILVLPENRPEHWMVLSDLAAAHRMSVNVGYFARVDADRLDKARTAVAATVIANTLDPRALYVFTDDLLWNAAIARLNSADLAGVKDSIRFIAPGFNARSRSDDRRISVSPPSATNSFVCRPGERLVFDTTGTGHTHCVYGWSAAEPCGTWSDGDSSMFLFKFSPVPRTDLELIIGARAFITETHTSQRVEVRANGRALTTLTYTAEQHDSLRSLVIPLSCLRGGEGVLRLCFYYNDAASLVELGLSPDVRRLGLCVQSVEMKPY